MAPKQDSNDDDDDDEKRRLAWLPPHSAETVLTFVDYSLGSARVPRTYVVSARGARRASRVQTPAGPRVCIRISSRAPEPRG